METLLTYELEKRGHIVRAEVPVPVTYGDVIVHQAFFIDLLIDDLVIVELKSVEDLAPVHFKQMVTYLKFANKRLGFLINFNTALLKHGIRRIVNGLEDK